MDVIRQIKDHALNNNIPIIQDEGLHFLLEMIDKYNVQSLLELGSATGYSSIMMAKSKDEILIDTVEIDNERYSMALENIVQANLQDQITITNIDAYKYETDKQYDMIFLDAAKAQYKGMLEKFWVNLKIDGIVVVDNLMFHGFVESYPNIKNRNTRQLVRKIIEFRHFIADHESMQVQFFDEIGDGLAVIIKKGGLE